MRIFRMVATPVLLLGLLGFLIWGALWGWRNLTAPLPTPEPTPCVVVTPSSKAVTVRDMAVRVYNGGFQSGLAQRVSTQLEDAGMRVLKTSNTEERVTGTVIRLNQDNFPAQRLVSSYFVEPRVEFDDRIDGTVDVLVGSDWKGMNEDVTTRLIQVSPGESGTACLPASPSATPSGSPVPVATPSKTN